MRCARRRGAVGPGGGRGLLGLGVAGGAGGGVGQRRGEDGGDLGAGGGLGGAAPGGVAGADGAGDPGAVEQAALVGLGHQVLGLVVVATGRLHGPEVDGDAVLLRGGHTGQQVAVAGDQDDVGAGLVAGEFGEFGVHGGVHALLGPPPVTAGQGAEADGDAGHDAQPAVLGLGDAVGGAVEPVDAQQGLGGLGLGAFAELPDEGGVVDGDTGAGGVSGEQAGGGAQQVSGVHQDDAAVHAYHLIPSVPGRAGARCRVSFESARPGER